MQGAGAGGPEQPQGLVIRGPILGHLPRSLISYHSYCEKTVNEMINVPTGPFAGGLSPPCSVLTASVWVAPPRVERCPSCNQPELLGAKTHDNSLRPSCSQFKCEGIEP